MSRLFTSEQFAQNIHPGHIYYFKSDKFVSSTPHYFICISNSNNEFHFVCCTSQFNTLNRYVDSGLMEPETIVYIKPNKLENGLTLDTYVNCNETFTYTRDEIKAMYDSEALDHTGNLNEEKQAELQVGIMRSELLEEDLKEMIIDGFTKIEGINYE